MMHSTTQPWKILRTKKRLSDDTWLLPNATIALLGLLVIMTFCLKVPSLSWPFGIVEAELPVQPVSIEDPAYHRMVVHGAKTLSEKTPMVVLTRKALYFGDIGSFTTGFADARQKFSVPHIDGQPQVGLMLNHMEVWQHQRQKGQDLTNEGLVILLPTEDIPTPIVVQTISLLSEKQKGFQRVLLAGGLH